jgi:hypothetical protein
MSDFSIPTNSITDGNNIANLSDVEYYDDDDDNYQTDQNIIIDMDDINDEPIVYSNKILGKLVPKKEIMSNDKKSIENNFNVKGKPKLVITKKTNSTPKTQEKDNTDKKENKVGSRFEFNEQTIDFYAKDANLNIKNICIKKSQFRNDTVLLCLLFKANIFTEYRCNIKKCKTAKIWLGKPIQLLINRKNGRLEDLTINNLELICPNCFIVQYGLELFQKVADQTIYKCKLCNFPLNKFSNIKKKEGYCLACENKMINASYYSKQNDYINELKETIDDTSALKQDEFTKSNYYNEVSKYKTFKDCGKSKDNIKSSSSNTNKINDKPIISLNMNIPDLTKLINEDIYN